MCRRDSSPNGSISQLTPEIVRSEFHLFESKPARPREFVGLDVSSDGIFTAPNAATGARIAYWLKDRTDDPVSITIEDLAGHTVRKLTGGGSAVINRVSWDLQGEELERLPNHNEGPGEKIYVPAGDYKVKVSAGKAGFNLTSRNQ